MISAGTFAAKRNEFIYRRKDTGHTRTLGGAGTIFQTRMAVVGRFRSSMSI
jgi:hypothetical protein